MASFNYGLELDTDESLENIPLSTGDVNLGANIKKNIALPPKAESERAHSPSLPRKENSDVNVASGDYALNDNDYVDINFNNGLYTYQDINNDSSAELSNNFINLDNPDRRYSLAEGGEVGGKLEVGKPSNIILIPNDKIDPKNVETDGKKISPEGDAVDMRKNEDMSNDIDDSELHNDDMKVTSYENLNLKIDSTDNNNLADEHSYESFPHGESVASRKKHRTSDTSSLSSIQRDYEMVSNTTVDYLNNLPSNNNNGSIDNRRSTKESYDEIDLGSYIEPKQSKSDYQKANKQISHSKGKIPHGFAYVIRPIGVFFIINMIFALIIPAVIFTWEEQDKNDAYADGRIEVMMVISVYICVCLFLQIIIGIAAKQKSRIHLAIFIHNIVMVVLILAASICVAVVAEEIRDDGNCSTNECDNLVTVTVIGFLLFLFLIIQTIFYWLDLLVFGYRCECCIEIFRIEEE